MNRVPRYIYFMKPKGFAGPIKIGCSYIPASRLLALSFWSPFELEIIAVAPGGFDVERSLHERFAEQRGKYEWFKETPELLDLVDALKRGELLVDIHPARVPLQVAA